MTKNTHNSQLKYYNQNTLIVNKAAHKMKLQRQSCHWTQSNQTEELHFENKHYVDK